MAPLKIVIAHRARLSGEALAAVLQYHYTISETVSCRTWLEVLKATNGGEANLAVIDEHLVPDSYLSLGTQLFSTCPVILVNDHTPLAGLVQKVSDFADAPGNPSASKRAAPSVCDSLTARETDIFRLMVDGLSNKQIAANLYITQRTVKFHVSNVLRKLKSQSRTEAVAFYLRSLQGPAQLEAAMMAMSQRIDDDDKTLERVL